MNLNTDWPWKIGFVRLFFVRKCAFPSLLRPKARWLGKISHLDCQVGPGRSPIDREFSSQTVNDIEQTRQIHRHDIAKGLLFGAAILPISHVDLRERKRGRDL